MECMRLPEMTILQHFSKKGKIQLIELMQKNQKFVDVFTNLIDFPLNTDTFDVLQQFTCHLYGHAKQNDISEVIKLHFEGKTKPNCTERPLGNIKSVEQTSLSYEAYPMDELTPIYYGWKLLEGSNLLTVMWFEGQQVQQEIENVLALDESDDKAMDYESGEVENGSDIEN